MHGCLRLNRRNACRCAKNVDVMHLPTLESRYTGKEDESGCQHGCKCLVST